MDRTIFVSYARENAAHAKRVQRYLQGQGWSVWVDEDGIRGAARWAGEIEQAIREAAAVVVLLSHHAAASEWVDRELVAATEQGVPIVVVELEHTPLAPGTEFLLRARQRVRLEGAGLSRLDDAVNRAVGERSRARPGRARLFVGRVLTALGCLGIVAGLALFGFGFVSVVGIVWGGETADAGADIPVGLAAFGIFAVSVFVYSRGRSMRRAARLKAMRRGTSTP